MTGTRKYSVAIVGAGGIGAAIGKVLEEKKEINVDFWDVDPAKLERSARIEDVCSRADIIFLCVPSWTVREAIKNITPCVREDAPIISVSKGVEDKTGKNMNELLSEILSDANPWALFSGPMLADELRRGMMGSGVVAAQEKNAFHKSHMFLKIQSVFAGTNLAVEYSLDAQGVALCGVLKNFYAIALGVVSALGLGNNATGLFVARALKEMANLIQVLGGNSNTVFGSAGVGDFIATGFSEYSKNRRAGEELIKKGICLTKSEGCVSIEPFVKSLAYKKIDMPPILSAIYQSLRSPESTRNIFLKVLKLT